MVDTQDPGNNGGIIAQLANGVRALGNIATVLTSTFPIVSGTATSATAGAATLPANPVGFIVVTLPSGVSAKVPYYS